MLLKLKVRSLQRITRCKQRIVSPFTKTSEKISQRITLVRERWLDSDNTYCTYPISALDGLLAFSIVCSYPFAPLLLCICMAAMCLFKFISFACLFLFSKDELAALQGDGSNMGSIWNALKLNLRLILTFVFILVAYLVPGLSVMFLVSSMFTTACRIDYDEKTKCCKDIITSYKSERDYATYLQRKNFLDYSKLRKFCDKLKGDLEKTVIMDDNGKLKSLQAVNDDFELIGFMINEVSRYCYQKENYKEIEQYHDLVADKYNTIKEIEEHLAIMHEIEEEHHDIIEDYQKKLNIFDRNGVFWQAFLLVCMYLCTLLLCSSHSSPVSTSNESQSGIAQSIALIKIKLLTAKNVLVFRQQMYYSILSGLGLAAILTLYSAYHARNEPLSIINEQWEYLIQLLMWLIAAIVFFERQLVPGMLKHQSDSPACINETGKVE